MERVGERLRQRRIELGLTIAKVAELTKFRTEIITAVEEGRPDVFPAEAYLKAFLRAYAETLGLNPEEVIHYQESEEDRMREALRGIRLRPRKGKPLKPILLLLGGAAAAVVVAFLIFGGISDLGRGPEDEPSEGAEPGLTAESARAEVAVPDSATGPEEVEDEEVAAQGPPEGAAEETPEGIPLGTPPGGAAGRESAGTAAAELADVSGEMEGEEQAADQTVAETEATEPPGGAVEIAGEGEEPGEPSGPAGGGEAADQTVEIQDSEPPGERVVETPELEPVANGTEHRLEIVARGGFLITIASGGREVFGGQLTGGDRRILWSSEQFEIVFLSDRTAVTILQDGREVSLPRSGDRSLYNYKIPIPEAE
jgi:cytoskeleton protein RodZ